MGLCFSSMHFSLTLFRASVSLQVDTSPKPETKSSTPPPLRTALDVLIVPNYDPNPYILTPKPMFPNHMFPILGLRPFRLAGWPCCRNTFGPFGVCCILFAKNTRSKNSENPAQAYGLERFVAKRTLPSGAPAGWIWCRSNC